MSKIIKGKLIQDGIPTPEKPVEIKSLNLFEVNGIQYTDNIPDNMNIGITKEQYCEYLQLKEMFEASKTYSKQFLYKHNKNLLEANERLRQKNEQLKEKRDLEMQLDLHKEVIEEVREYIKECSSREISLDILEILDKVKEK